MTHDFLVGHTAFQIARGVGIRTIRFFRSIEARSGSEGARLWKRLKE